MRVCAVHSSTCVSTPWKTVVAPHRLRFCHETLNSWHGQRQDRCKLVVSWARGLSGLAEGDAVRQASFSESLRSQGVLSGHTLRHNRSLPYTYSRSSALATPNEDWTRPAWSRCRRQLEMSCNHGLFREKSKSTARSSASLALLYLPKLK